MLVALACIFAAVAWAAAAALWRQAGRTGPAASLFLLGVSLGPCLAGYALVNRRRKQSARRLVLFTGGLSILAWSLFGSVNLEIEGFFMLLFAGAAGAATGHTLITVIAGPLLFGRILCGWGCWRAMVLELLPVHREGGRRKGRWRLLPFAGLGISAGAGLSLLVLGHDAEHPGVAALLAAFGIYYAAAIGMAFALHDPRAFCKYLCPNSAILRYTSRRPPSALPPRAAFATTAARVREFARWTSMSRSWRPPAAASAPASASCASAVWKPAPPGRSPAPWAGSFSPPRAERTRPAGSRPTVSNAMVLASRLLPSLGRSAHARSQRRNRA